MAKAKKRKTKKVARKKEHWKKREKRALSRGATPAFAKRYGLQKVTEEELDEHIRLRIKKTTTKTRTAKKGRKKTMAKKKRKTTKRKKTTAKRRKTKRKTKRKSPKRKTTAKRRKTTAKRKSPKRKTTRRKTKRKTSRKKARRGTTRRKAVETEVVRSVKVPKSRTQVVRVELTTPSRRSTSKKSKRKKSKRKRNPTSTSIQHNPAETEMVAFEENSGYFGGLLGNPNGPFATASLQSYALAAGGVGTGLVIAGFLDRFVATRTPSDSESPEATANNPWYGRDAAAAQRRRPDAMRLGAQAAGALVAMALTYWTRNGRILPWLLGGTAVGFGANMLKMLTDWYAMPAIFKVDDPTEESFANRMYPLEQADIQEEVDALFENWASVPALLAGQAEEPVIQSPLASPTGSGVYTLGKAGRGSGNGHPQPQGLGAPGTRRFIGKPNMLGKRCNSCGGYGGCWADCRTMTGYMETGNCAECGDGNHPSANEKQCAYTVQPGDSLAKIAQASGTSVELVSSLNQGRPLSELSRAGTKVVLPYGMCMYVSKMPEGAAPPPAPATVRGNPVIPSTGEGPIPAASNAAPFPPGSVPAQSVPPALPAGTTPAQFGTTTMNVPAPLRDMPNAPMAAMSLAGAGKNGDSRSPEERVMSLFNGGSDD